MDKRAWWKEAVVYQIYPRSFMDSNGDGIGDLQGIISRLDYLKTLGVDVIWVSPIYASPNDDNGYDISDYQAIMAEFGTMADFDELLAGVHARGMKLVMDLVANHTSDEHAWFVESRSSLDNPKRDYYIWRDGKDGKEPNNWGSVFSGSAWQYDETTGQYYLHLFSRKQPDLNWANPKVREEIYSMMRWWCDKGIDGFRMDVIGFIGKESYQDGRQNPGDLHGDFNPFCVNTETSHRFVQEMNREVLQHYDLLTVGETGGSVEQAFRYAGNHGQELGMVFNFDHVDLGSSGPMGKWNDTHATMPELRHALNNMIVSLQDGAWNSLFMSNHDQPRQVSRFGNDSPMYRARSAKLLATMLHMMRGTPYIYQGEELGMTNVYFTDMGQYRDVENLNAWREWVESGLTDPEDMLRYFALRSRDNARTPMQWTAGPNGGFTTGTPWITCGRNCSEINAEDQLADPDSVFHYYRRLIELRHTHDIIVYGRFIPMLEDDEKVYAFRRELDGKTLTVACNFSDQTVACDVTDIPGSEELICNVKKHKPGSLYPWEARVILY